MSAEFFSGEGLNIFFGAEIPTKHISGVSELICLVIVHGVRGLRVLCDLRLLVQQSTPCL